jgi:ketosteroid isomerase-like protein
VARRVALICLVALLAGCGGDDDKKDAEQTVRDFVTAVNERDADAYCDELITKEFREKSTFAKGDKASDSCKRQLKAIKGLDIELVRIAGTKVDGDKATVTVVFRRSGQPVRQRVLLEKDGGDWKIAGGGGS